MSKPELWVLEREPWQYFGTLTSKEWELSRERWRSISFSLFRWFAKEAQIYFPSLPWVLREERGEITGKAHVHFLLGGLPAFKVNVATAFRAMWQVDLKNAEGLKVGHSRIRLYDRSQNGTGYIVKCLSGMAGNDVYEFSKFGGDLQELTLSQALHTRVSRSNDRAARVV